MTMHESQQFVDDGDDDAVGVFVDDIGSISSSTGGKTPENPLFKGSAAPINKHITSNTRDVQQPSHDDEEYDQSAPLIPTEIQSHPRHESLPDNFHESPEPISNLLPGETSNASFPADQPYHSHRQMHENESSGHGTGAGPIPNAAGRNQDATTAKAPYFVPCYPATRLIFWISTKFFEHEDFAVATWMGFWALHNVTCANYVLSPMRDAVALKVGVKNIPKLTLASSVLALLSSVPIGWLFEAPDPSRRKLWKKMGLTRGETQGTSLALFYRFFALSVLSYAFGFQVMELLRDGDLSWLPLQNSMTTETTNEGSYLAVVWEWMPFLVSKLGKIMDIAFYLVVHLMKLHSISLVWGVTTEAMEYEDVARKGKERKLGPKPKVLRTRLERLAMIGFGGTLGGIWGR